MNNSTLESLRSDCEQALSKTGITAGKPLVFGEGFCDRPPLMLIGEAPGEQEVMQKRPFVGKAGKNLTEFLRAVGLSREMLYISNVVKIRPTKVSAAGRVVNRPPSREEVFLFTPWLYREVALVKPRALVTLGNTALHAFVPADVMIGDCHGCWRTVRVPVEHSGEMSIKLYPLYHPASVIYNRSLTTVYQTDLQLLAQSLKHSDWFSDT